MERWWDRSNSYDRGHYFEIIQKNFRHYKFNIYILNRVSRKLI